jgi:hypothetical protein
MENEIKEALSFIDKVTNHELESIKSLWLFIPAFMEKYRKEEAKLPYHINVIDELRANENAHSRILAKLLQHKAGNRFEMLESFVEYLAGKRSGLFCTIKVESPEITQGTEWIDLWIRDKTYAIIIENKIHYAADQERQLANYIDKTKEQKREEEIFVIYLSPQYEEPTEQSWGGYQERFKDRYLNLSFKYDILPWLKDKVLPNLKLKDAYLRSAIEQYIDHLEGMFGLRTNNHNTHMELQEFIKQELGLQGNPREDISKLSAKQEDIKKVNEQIEMLKNEAEKVIFKEWQTKISAKYPDLEAVYEKGKRVGLIIPVDDTTSVKVAIAFDSPRGPLYCQADMDLFNGQSLPEVVREKARHLLPDKNNKNQIWKYFDRLDYDGAFQCLQDVLEILVDKK